jgi:hypothetical protein
VVYEVLYEERLSVAERLLNEVKARADVANIIEDGLLLVIEVSVFHHNREVMFEAANV